MAGPLLATASSERDQPEVTAAASSIRSCSITRDFTHLCIAGTLLLLLSVRLFMELAGLVTAGTVGLWALTVYLVIRLFLALTRKLES